MKIIKNHEEAVNLIKKDIENTMSIKVSSAGREMVLVGCLERREYTEFYPEEFYPEGMIHYQYGFGCGWSVSMQRFLCDNEGDTLIAKLVSEQGMHCGDIGLNNTDCIESYADIDNIFIEGTDKEIQDILPHLAEGNYCFIFIPEDDYARHIHAEVENKYLQQDAHKAILAFAELPGFDAGEREYVEAHVDDMLSEFNRLKDDSVSNEDTWTEVIYSICRRLGNAKSTM